jgi:hypothetical protein
MVTYVVAYVGNHVNHVNHVNHGRYDGRGGGGRDGTVPPGLTAGGRVETREGTRLNTTDATAAGVRRRAKTKWGAVRPPGQVNTEEAARLLGRSPNSVIRFGQKGWLTPYQTVKFGPIFYRKAEVVALARRLGIDV